MAGIDEVIGVILSVFPLLVRDVESRSGGAFGSTVQRRCFSTRLDVERAKFEINIDHFLSTVAPEWQLKTTFIGPLGDSNIQSIPQLESKLRRAYSKDFIVCFGLISRIGFILNDIRSDLDTLISPSKSISTLLKSKERKYLEKQDGWLEQLNWCNKALEPIAVQGSSFSRDSSLEGMTADLDPRLFRFALLGLERDTNGATHKRLSHILAPSRGCLSRLDRLIVGIIIASSLCPYSADSRIEKELHGRFTSSDILLPLDHKTGRVFAAGPYFQDAFSNNDPSTGRETLFDLGILLIELCLNRVVKSKYLKLVKGTLSKSRYAIQLISEVSHVAGKRYADVVRKCLLLEMPELALVFSDDVFVKNLWLEILQSLIDMLDGFYIGFCNGNKETDARVSLRKSVSALDLRNQMSLFDDEVGDPVLGELLLISMHMNTNVQNPIEPYESWTPGGDILFHKLKISGSILLLHPRVERFLMDFVNFIFAKLNHPDGEMVSCFQCPSIHFDADVCNSILSYKKHMIAHAKSRLENVILQIIEIFQQEICRMVRKRVLSNLLDPRNEKAAMDHLHRLAAELSFGQDINSWASYFQTKKPGGTVGRVESFSGSEFESEIPVGAFEKLEEFLENRDPFEALMRKLRKCIFRLDGTTIYAIERRVASAIMEQEKDSDHLFGVTFNVFWELPTFMEAEFEEPFDIGSVLTVTAQGQDAYAATCLNYCKGQWPRMGWDLWSYLQHSTLTFANQFSIDIKPHSEWAGIFKCLRINNTRHPSDEHLYGVASNNIVSITAFCSREQMTEIGQQLAWLAASFRLSDYERPMFSEVSFHRTPKSTSDLSFDIVPMDLQELPRSDSDCWYPLFSKFAVVRGFPIPDRGDERGLQIEFPVLKALAGIFNPILYDNGLIYKGFSTMLIPTKYSQQNRSIQWHLLIEGNGEQRLHIWKAKDFKTRLRTLEYEFESSKCYLGYCADCIVNLGSPRTRWDRITWSAATARPVTPKVDALTFGFGGGVAGLPGPNAAATVKMGNHRGLQHVRVDRSFDQVCKVAKDLPVLLYDPHERRAWLVPALSLMLHMVLKQISDDKLEPWKGGKIASLPTIEPTWNSGQAVYEKICDNIGLELRSKHHNPLISKGVLFRDLILRMWNALEAAHALRIEIGPPTGMTLSLRKQYEVYHGLEFMTLTTTLPPFIIKEEKIKRSSGGWTYLTFSTLTIFCSGLGDVITPDPTSRFQLCRSLDPIPLGKDYLIASITALKQLSEKSGGGESCKMLCSLAGIKWHFSQTNPFKACEHPRNTPNPCVCKRLQHLAHERTWNKFLGQIRLPQNLRLEGAVVFGKVTLAEKLIPKLKATSPQASLDLLNQLSEQLDDVANKEEDMPDNRAISEVQTNIPGEVVDDGEVLIDDPETSQEQDSRVSEEPNYGPVNTGRTDINEEQYSPMSEAALKEHDIIDVRENHGELNSASTPPEVPRDGQNRSNMNFVCLSQPETSSSRGERWMPGAFTDSEAESEEAILQPGSSDNEGSSESESSSLGNISHEDASHTTILLRSQPEPLPPNEDSQRIPRSILDKNNPPENPELRNLETLTEEQLRIVREARLRLFAPAFASAR